MAGILGLGAGLSIIISASSALAVSFNFSFNDTSGGAGTISGTITGLADNTNNQTTGFTVAVTSSPGNKGLGTYTYDTNPSVLGFNVSSGNITVADWSGTSAGNFLYFNPGNFVQLTDFGSYNFFDNGPTTLTFTPVATAVPFEFSPSLGLALVGLGLGASKLKQLSKNKKS
jgi:hypothetical protein